MAANMSLAAVAVRNQRKKQKVQAALFLAQHPVLPVLPATELPGGAALLLLELGRVNPGGKEAAGAKPRRGSALSRASSKSGSACTDGEEVNLAESKLEPKSTTLLRV